MNLRNLIGMTLETTRNKELLHRVIIESAKYKTIGHTENYNYTKEKMVFLTFKGGYHGLYYPNDLELYLTKEGKTLENKIPARNGKKEQIVKYTTRIY